MLELFCKAELIVPLLHCSIVFVWQWSNLTIEQSSSFMFGNLFSLFSHDIGIDLGTANTLVWVKGKGIVIREPSIVAIHKKTKKLLALGTEAKKMLGKTPESIITIKPLKGGVISDFNATSEMISRF